MAKYNFFISYSSKDEEIAFKIVNAIESAGYTCWIAPRNIPYGTPYASAIMEGIDGCDKFLVLITKNSVKSRDVLNEVDNAHSAKKTILPVRLTDTELPRELNYYLSRTQWLTIHSSKPEEIVKLLNIGGVAPVPPNPVPPRPIKGMLVFAIAAIIAIGAGVAIWWFVSDKSKNLDEENTSLINIYEVSEDTLNVNTFDLDEKNISQSEKVENVSVKKPDSAEEPKESNSPIRTSLDLESIKKEADQHYEKKEYELSLPLYIKIAEYDKNYSHKVGFMYQYGQGTPQNPIVAIQWYKKIANYHSGAHESLVNLYEQLAKQCVNVGNNKDAAHWYEELGALYMNEKNYKNAAYWYEMGNKTGFLDSNCKYWLGHLYYTGQGVTKDLKKAKDYWEQAASEGDEKAKADSEKYFKE